MNRSASVTSMAEAADGAAATSPPGARQVVGEHVSPRRAAVRRFLRHRLAIVGVVVLLAIMHHGRILRRC